MGTIKIIEFIAMIALAAGAYRMGGSSNGKRWMREIGVGLAEIIALTILFGWNWWGLLIMGTIFLETTYFKRKGTEATWLNWLLVGLSFALVPLPYIIADGHHWIGFLWRTAFIVPFVCIWRTIIGQVTWEEGMSGGIQVLSLLLLLIK